MVGLLAWSLIIQYMVFSPGWDLVHSRVHREVEVTHFEKDEANACHRSIFHGEKDDHQGHIVQHVHCSSCHLAPHPVLSIDLVADEIRRPDSTLIISFSGRETQAGGYAQKSPRAPPFIV